jgi:hypothetical protein
MNIEVYVILMMKISNVIGMMIIIIKISENLKILFSFGIVTIAIIVLDVPNVIIVNNVSNVLIVMV